MSGVMVIEFTEPMFSAAVSAARASSTEASAPL